MRKDLTMVKTLIEPCPFDEVLPLEDIQQPKEPKPLKPVLVKYHKDSPLQAMVSVFYAKVKVKGKWEYRGAKNTWFKKDLTLLDVYNLIISQAFKTETDTLQGYTDDKEAKKFKEKHFNYACFSGSFKYRNDKSLIKHSRLICIDLDKLGAELYWIRETVNNDPLTIMSFVSPSGAGLKVIYQIDPEKHSQSTYYQYLSDYLSNLCCLPKKAIDEACKDVSRACFLPYDPFCFINLNLL